MRFSESGTIRWGHEVNQVVGTVAIVLRIREAI